MNTLRISNEPASDKNSTISAKSHSAMELPIKVPDFDSDNSGDEVERDWDFSLEPMPMKQTANKSDTTESPSPRARQEGIID